MRPSLLVLGVILGLALGVLYGWVISPVKYTDTDPASLRADYKEQYLILVASAYQADGSLERARARLATLRDPDSMQTITALAQRMAAEGKDPAALAALAADLAGGVQPVASASGTPVSTAAPTLPTETLTPPPTVPLLPSLTPFPTLTPTATPVYDYAVIIREQYCNHVERLPLIIVDVVDATGAPLPGVRVTVTWAEGEDGFVTGLKPEISASYGDYLMTVGTRYSVQVGSRTPPVGGIIAPTCVDVEGETYAGAVRLVFQRK